ncbi:HNH endonuclease [Pontibacillus sp. HMF3514]|uniref:HNH endonuclease n=1 Tax=Pontibacillus sp. HMF3514 TaxID=2692425 RepID=UPI00131FF261|nr:HNH endonuclease [Pontibacillus sp. HMF3514]QHE51679.1 hypothetical protein GS400_06350 [Pontibacillus sp. HMF3514]
MSNIDVFNILNKLQMNYDVNLEVKNLSPLEIRPTDLEKGEGFMLRLMIDWRSISAEFIPDNFSAKLIQTMGRTTNKNVFNVIARKVLEDQKKIDMKINHKDVSPISSTLWDDHWSLMELKVENHNIIVNEKTVETIEDKLFDVGNDLLGLILSLLPLDYSRDIEFELLPEGAVSRVKVNKYERSPANRQACIAIHGTVCKVCEFDFESMYGRELGKGYIHVHHLTPISEMGEGYIINPTTDLVPICPNCHAMIHRRNPPYSISDLKSIIRSNKIYK